MLDFIRRGIKSIFAQILLGLLIISFAVWGIGDIFTGRSGSTVAYVGETEVDSDTLTRALVRQQRLLSQQAQQLVSFSDMRAARIDQQIMASLVRDATFTEELSTLDIAIPDTAVAEFIAVNPAFLDAQGRFNPLAYEGSLAQQGFTPQEYERLVRQRIGQDILADPLTQGLSAPPAFAEAIARHDGERRRVAVIRMPASDAPEPETPEDSTLTAYLEANPETFRLPERRSGQYLWISQAALAEELRPTDEEVAAEYERNPEVFSQEAVRVVEQIVFEDQAAADDAARRLADGDTSFVEIATEMNLTLDDIQLGELREGELAPAASTAVFEATEPSVVGPVDGPFGPILLNVTAVTLGGTPPLEDVAGEIAERIAIDRAHRAAIEKIQQIDEMRASGEPLDDIAAATGLELTRFSGLDRAGTVTEGDAPVLAADPRFWAEVSDANVGEERDIAEMSDNSYALVLLGRVEESRIPELDEVRDAVLAAWTADQRLAAQEASAVQLATGGSDLETISATALHGISERSAFNRAEPPEDFSPALVEAIFDVDDGEIAVGRSADGAAVLIAQVRGVIPVDAETLADQIEQLDAALSGAIARDQLEFYARALEERHGAGVNIGAVDGLFEQLGQTGFGHGGM